MIISTDTASISRRRSGSPGVPALIKLASINICDLRAHKAVPYTFDLISGSLLNVNFHSDGSNVNRHSLAIQFSLSQHEITLLAQIRPIFPSSRCPNQLKRAFYSSLSFVPLITRYAAQIRDCLFSDGKVGHIVRKFSVCFATTLFVNGVNYAQTHLA